MSLLANSNAIEDAGYKIQRSLRFRSSASAYLNRTPASAGNRTTWTWSGWVKRGTVGYGILIDVGGTTNNTDYQMLWFAADTIDFHQQTTTGLTARITTNAVYRDSSAWYHIVAVWNSSSANSTLTGTPSDRMQLWVNGVQVTSFSATVVPTQNLNSRINLNALTTIGQSASGTAYSFDGYLAEVNFIDGQALTPSSFGQTDAVTGIWTPKKYTGTYGTNGFYLDFKTNTSPTTLAQDKSGNGNNWTANNISTTAGATYDSMTDVPTLTSATAANFATLNPISLTSTGGTLSDGNLTFQTTTGTPHVIAVATQVITTKSYCEFQISSSLGSAVGPLVVDIDKLPISSGNGILYIASGTVYIPSALTGYPTFTNGDMIGVAYDPATKTAWFSKNNTWINGNPSAGTGGFVNSALGSNVTFGFDDETSSYAATVYANFGQRPFSYTPPTGFKALNTFNLPDPVIKKPNQYMDVITYTGDGSSSRTFTGLAFQPDLLWSKSRSNAYSHKLYDSVRGVNAQLSSNATSAEATTDSTVLQAFTSNGITFGSDAGINGNGSTFVDWFWKKGATPGFDIVTYTGTGVARTVSHNLGVAPAMIIVKDRTAARTVSQWPVYHASLGNTKACFLNATDAAFTDSTYFNNTSPTSSVFSLGSWGGINYSGDAFVAYLFAEIPGFSKFGSYTGNGSADGPFLNLGFLPKYFLFKRTDTAADWQVWDSSRDTYNIVGKVLYPNTSGAEAGSQAAFDMVSNGIKFRNAGVGNNSGGTYIFAAFAENPFKYSLAR